MSLAILDGEEIGKFLKRQRLKVGMSQATVADLLGYSTPQFVSNWERGVVLPPLETVAKLVALFDISKDELIDVMVEDFKQVLDKSFSPKARKKPLVIEEPRELSL